MSEKALRRGFVTSVSSTGVEATTEYSIFFEGKRYKIPADDIKKYVLVDNTEINFYYENGIVSIPDNFHNSQIPRRRQ